MRFYYRLEQEMVNFADLFTGISILHSRREAGKPAREIGGIHGRSRRETGLAGIGQDKPSFARSAILSNPCQTRFSPHFLLISSDLVMPLGIEIENYKAYYL
jgi:hypothetical protein